MATFVQLSSSEVLGDQPKQQWILTESKAKLKAEWDHGYSTGFWNSMSEAPVERARSAIIAGYYFQKLYGNNPDATYLDVGGGEGVMSDYLSAKQKKRYTCVDISEAGAKMGRTKRPGVEFVVSPAEDFNLDKSRKFNFVLFSEMIYYCKHMEVFRQYQPYLQPDGVIALSVWFRDNHPSANMGPAVFNDAKNTNASNLVLMDSMCIRGNTYSYQTNLEMPAGFHVGIFKTPSSTVDLQAANKHTGHLTERLRSAIVSGTYYQKYVAGATPGEGLSGRMLDIGCKDGSQLVYLLPAQRVGYVGLDSSDSALATAREKVGAHGVNVTFVSVKHAADYTPTVKFSMVVLSDLVYKGDHKKLLTRVKSYLEPGGYLVVNLGVSTEGPERAISQGKRDEIFTAVAGQYELLDEFTIQEDVVSGVVRTTPPVDLRLGIYQVQRTWANLVKRVDDVQAVIRRQARAKGSPIPSILTGHVAGRSADASSSASSPSAVSSSSSSSSSLSSSPSLPSSLSQSDPVKKTSWFGF